MGGYVGPGGQWIEVEDTPAQGGVIAGDKAAQLLALVSEAGKRRAEIVRRAVAASSDNTFTRLPMTAVQAWTANQAVVTGERRSNGGNDYEVRVGGTCAASGGPTGSSLYDITDNTVTWMYVGPTRAAGSGYEVPTITFTNTRPSLLTQQRNSVTGASSFLFTGTPVPSGGGVLLTQVSSLQAGGVVTTTPGKDNCNPAIQFITDAQVIAVESASVMSSARKFWIEIDGVLYRDAPITGDGSGVYMLISFAGKTRRQRHIKIHWRRGAPEVFNGIWIASHERAWAPTSPRIMMWGDSHTAGSNYGALIAGEDMPSIVGRLLGVDDVWNCGQGSAGFLTTAGGTRYRYIERLVDATAPNPDVLVIVGSHNDSATDRPTTAAGILAFLQAFRAACHNTAIICFGTWRSLVLSAAVVADMEGAMSDAVAAFADPLTVFVPVNSDPAGPWTNGTKYSGVTGITNAAQAVVTFGGGLVASPGDTAMMVGINGMAINGIPARVVSATGTSMTLDLDSTALGTFTSSPSGHVYINDIYTAPPPDTVHVTQQGIVMLAQRYARGIRQALQSLA